MQVYGLLGCLLVRATAGDSSRCRLSNALSDGMVLQQGKKAHVFGFGTSGATVRIRSSLAPGVVEEATVDEAGWWDASLAPQPASNPDAPGFTISFACSSGESFSLVDVLLGDVFVSAEVLQSSKQSSNCCKNECRQICGGQSNSEFAFGQPPCSR